MRLYVEAKSKLGIGYTPDCVVIDYEKDSVEYELRLDIQGYVECGRKDMSSRCKGELAVASLVVKETGEEVTDTSFLTDTEIAEAICLSEHIAIGIYPSDGCEETYAMCSGDEISQCEGSFEMSTERGHFEREFTFEPFIEV